MFFEGNILPCATATASLCVCTSAPCVPFLGQSDTSKRSWAALCGVEVIHRNTRINWFRSSRFSDQLEPSGAATKVGSCALGERQSLQSKPLPNEEEARLAKGAEVHCWSWKLSEWYSGKRSLCVLGNSFECKEPQAVKERPIRRRATRRAVRSTKNQAIWPDSEGAVAF